MSHPSGWLYATGIEPITFYGAQRIWMDGIQGKMFEMTKKSRRVGYTFSKGRAAIARAHIYPGSTTIFTSMNLQEAYDKIEVAKQTYYNIHPSMRKEMVTDTRLMLEFAHSSKQVSRILCMFKPRGQKGTQIFIDIDEFDHIQDQEAVLTAAIANVSHGGRLSLGTTVCGGRRFFDEMWSGSFKDAVDPQIKNLLQESLVRLEVPWWACPYLVADKWRNNLKYVMVEAPKMSTRDRVLTFGSKRLQYIYAMSYDEHFIQEYELIPLADGTAIINWDTIMLCTPTGDRKSIPNEVRELRNNRVAAFSDALTIAERLGGRLWLGYDVGRKKNASELTAFIEDARGSIMYEAYYETSENVPFKTQKDILRSYLSMSKRTVLTIDATQIGANVAEDLKREFKRRVIEVEFQNYNKLAMFDILLTQMQQRKVILCADRARMDQLFSIKRRVSEAGNVIYYVPRKERHHADKAVSQALGIFGRYGSGVRSFGSKRISTSGSRKGVGAIARPSELTPTGNFMRELEEIAG